VNREVGISATFKEMAQTSNASVGSAESVFAISNPRATLTPSYTRD
jgi:hypothetical protein